MLPDKIPTLYAAVRWLTASQIDLSTHGFWFENVLIVTVSVACSVSVLTKLNTTSVNSLSSDELARNMSQSTLSRAACSIDTEWEDQRVTSLSTVVSWTNLCLYSGVRKMASTWTGYMLMKVRHDLPEVGFVKVPCDDGGSVRVFVDVSTEHIVEFGQSQASVCLWWNVNSSNDDWWKIPGQIEWVADNGEMFQMRRAGPRQDGDIPGVTPFLVNHETHSSTFGFTGLGCSVHP